MTTELSGTELAWCRGGQRDTNISIALRIRGAIDEQRLVEILESLCARHSALRTTFASSPEGIWSRQVHARLLEAPRLIDATAWDDAAVAEHTRAASEDPLLPAETMFRTWIYARSPDERVLQLSMHHAIADWWSATLLLDELIDGLKGLSPAALPATAQLADYVAWETKRLGGSWGNRARAHWAVELGEPYKPLAFPALRKRDGTASGSWLVGTRELSAELSAVVGRLSVGRWGGVPAVLHALFHLVLGAFSGSARTTTFLISAGFRGVGQHGAIVGNLAKLVPSVMTAVEGDTATSFLRRLDETRMRAIMMQGPGREFLDGLLGPFANLVPRFNFFPPSSSGRLLYEHAPLEIGDLQVQRLPIGAGARSYLQLFAAERKPGQISLGIVCAQRHFDERSIARLLDACEGILARIAADPDVRVATLREAGAERVR